MLLAQFVGIAHKSLDDERQVPVDLHQVRAFVFGESYLIAMKSGKSYDVRDLDTILDVMSGEFELWKTQWRPDINIVSRGNTKFDGKTRVLEVTPAACGTFLPAPPVAKVVETVRRAVTIYNLTQTWDQFRQGNL